MISYYSNSEFTCGNHITYNNCSAAVIFFCMYAYLGTEKLEPVAQLHWQKMSMDSETWLLSNMYVYKASQNDSFVSFVWLNKSLWKYQHLTEIWLELCRFAAEKKFKPLSSNALMLLSTIHWKTVMQKSPWIIMGCPKVLLHRTL